MLLDFHFQFDDPDEASVYLTEMAEACQRSKAKLGSRPRKTAASPQAVEATHRDTVKLAFAEKLNGHAEPSEAGDQHQAPAEAVTETVAPKRGRGRPRKVESEAAKSEYAPKEKLTIEVRPPAQVSLDELRKFAESIVASKRPGALGAVSKVWREYGIKRASDLKPEQYAEVYQKLTALNAQLSLH